MKNIKINKLLYVSIVVMVFFVLSFCISSISFADDQSESSSEVDLIVKPEIISLPKKESEKLNLKVATASDVTLISSSVSYKNKDDISGILVQYLSAKQYKDHPREYVSAYTSESEEGGGMTVIPIFAYIIIEKGNLKEGSSQTFEVPNVYLIFKDEDQVKGVTPKGISFDPRIIMYDHDIVSEAVKELERKSILERKGLISAGAVLIISPDLLEEDAHLFNAVRKDFILNLSKFDALQRINNGKPIEQIRELTYLENLRAPYNYSLHYLYEHPIYMFERKARFGERAGKHHSMGKIIGQKSINYDYEPIIYNGSDATIEKLMDTPYGFTVKILGQEKPFETLLALTVSDKGQEMEIKNGDIIGIRRKGAVLYAAVKMDQIEKVKELLVAKEDVNFNYLSGDTLLGIAVKNNNYDLVKVLLDAGANVDAKEINGFPPLIIAVESEDLPMVTLLMKNNANVHVKDKTETSALMLALSIKNDAMIKLLSVDEAARIVVSNWSEAETVDVLVRYSYNLIASDASWSNPKLGRKIYDILKAAPEAVVVDSFVKNIGGFFSNVLFLAVKLGIPGSEKELNDVLLKHGDRHMAEAFMNSGNEELAAGGATWAHEHGYSIESSYGGVHVGWGSF